MITIAFGMLLCLSTQTNRLPPLTVHGADLEDPSGHRILLKGCNLGCWLMLESWMLDEAGAFKDQVDLESTLSQRFGRAEKDRLMNLFRGSWITPRDFKIIKSFGMNVVRLPMNYRLMEDDANPMHLRKDAWKWIDRAIDTAEAQGIYTILDMHGVQGGQNEYDHTGQAGQNKLWTNQEDQKRMAWLWGQIAHRYRNRSDVVAYDVFNEPYGDSKAQQVEIFSKVLPVIRKADPDKLVYAMGNYDGFEHYGNPHQNGWHNVGFEMHYYPGLFGNGDPSVMNYARHLNELKLVNQQVKALDVPFLVGEMNVVFSKAGGADMMRRAYDVDASYGWATTMWSYKTVSQSGGLDPSGGWEMVTNAKPHPKINFHKDSEAKIERFFRSLATEPYAVYEDLRRKLTDPHPNLPSLPAIPAPIISAPGDASIAGWKAVDLSGSLKGGLVINGDRSFSLYGGGSDVWGHEDQCRFLYRRVDGDFDLSVSVDGLLDTNSYAKAGLIARSNLESDSPEVLVTTFPSGEVQDAGRTVSGGEMNGSKSSAGALPVRLRMQRTSGQIHIYVARKNQPWQLLDTRRSPASALYVGLLALSHDNRQLTIARYSDLSLKE